MKKHRFVFLPYALLLSLLLTFTSVNVQADPLGNNSRSNATSLLNDTFSPGLPHLVILKTKNNVLGFLSASVGTRKLTGLNLDLVSEYYPQKSTTLAGGVDGNFLIGGNYGINLNGGYSHAVFEPDKDKKQRQRIDPIYAEVNFAGQYQGIILFGLGLGKDVYDMSARNELHEDTVKQKHDYTPITASVGLHLSGFLVGLGVTQFQENEKFTNEDATSKNWKMSGSVTVPKFGLGWSSINRTANSYQVSYAFASLPKRKTKTGDYYEGAKQRHNLTFEFQKQAFQTGLYFTNTTTAKGQELKSGVNNRIDLAFSYAPFTGNLISLVLFSEAEELKVNTDQDIGKPVLKTTMNGATFSYGWAF